MLLIALDHSTVSTESWWRSLTTAASSDGVRIALSVWNLVEIGFARDKAQQARRLTFLEGLQPLWFRDRVELQKLEVKSFLDKHHFKTDPNIVEAVTPHLSAVDYYFAGHSTRIGLTAAQFIAETDFDMLEREKHRVPAALNTLQSADRSKLKQVEQPMFEAWIRELIPDADPGGRLLKQSVKGNLLAYCWDNKADLLSECRALSVENALSIARTSDPKRNPTESDGIDLHHAVVGLAYGTIFATGDGYQAQCALAAKKQLGDGFAEVVRAPSALPTALAAL